MSRPFAVITAVWGEEYIDFYVEHILPRILPDGHSVVVATDDAEAFIKAADGKTNADVHVVYVKVSEQQRHHKYALAPYLEKVAMRFAAETLGIRRFVIQNPDVRISTAAFAAVSASEKHVITVPGIRVFKEEYLSIYGSPRSGSDDEVLLNAMTCLHPATKTLAVSGGYRRGCQRWPSTEYVIEPRRIFGVAYHRHPLMFDVPEGFDFDAGTGTVDDRFLSSLGYGFDDYEFPVHSSDGYVIEFSSFNHNPHHADCRALTRDAVAAFSRAHCTDEHREFARHPFTWSLDPSDVYENPFGLMVA